MYVIIFLLFLSFEVSIILSNSFHDFGSCLTSQMILKMICALLAMILESFGVYGEGKFDGRYGYVSKFICVDLLEFLTSQVPYDVGCL